MIGQACEFDYSGTQACRVLREEGYRVILANSNPATIMTDPDFADATYVEPLDVEVLEQIIERERPDAVLPTLGGQTALNLAMELYEPRRARTRHGTSELIGANAEAIATAEDRERFKVGHDRDRPRRAGVGHRPRPRRGPGGRSAAIGLPVVIRPAYILGGRGTGIASTADEFDAGSRPPASTPARSREILIESSIAGWKEFELEVMRDRADNCVVVCSIENVDPMGVHTGDSHHRRPRPDADATSSTSACATPRSPASGASGSRRAARNVQFAVDPANGDMVIIEMNPRVSRVVRALASKATGFPIAKIAARLAVGYTLDEIPNDITKKTPASFEPTIDYVVTKVPALGVREVPRAPPACSAPRCSRWARPWPSAARSPSRCRRALRSLEQGRLGLNCDPGEAALDELERRRAARRAADRARPTGRSSSRRRCGAA